MTSTRSVPKPRRLSATLRRNRRRCWSVLSTASSREGDVVLDPFCGCGTAIAVAQRLGRKWIGIDITHLAINLIRHRLQDAYGSDVAQSYEVIGEPEALPDAETLAQEDPYQFQWWALGRVGARPVEQKKGADRGIDGRLYFHDEGPRGRTKQIILSVKAGRTGVAHVRDLRGVVDREEAAIGVLISLQEPTRAMRQEVASAGLSIIRRAGTRTIRACSYSRWRTCLRAGGLRIRT